MVTYAEIFGIYTIREAQVFSSRDKSRPLHELELERAQELRAETRDARARRQGGTARAGGRAPKEDSDFWTNPNFGLSHISIKNMVYNSKTLRI